MNIQSYSEDELDWIEQVFERSEKLIHNNIWEGINTSSLKKWRGCLANHQAELLGAYLLDNLTYRSSDQFDAMLDSLFSQVERLWTNRGETFDLVTLQKHPGGSPTLLMAPVIGTSSPPTKSGPYILRLIQRRYRIHNKYLAWASQVTAGTTARTVIFIDDFSGTGDQFCKFGKSIRINEFHDTHPDCEIIYCVAVAHEKSIENIGRTLPFIRVLTAERLGDQHSLLSDASFLRYCIDGFKEKVIIQYQNVLSKAGLPVDGDLADGFGGLKLAYGFIHATPNNTLPIFWYDTPHWTPLLGR